MSANPLDQAKEDACQAASIGLSFMVSHMGAVDHFSSYQKNKWNDLSRILKRNNGDSPSSSGEQSLATGGYSSREAEFWATAPSPPGAPPRDLNSCPVSQAIIDAIVLQALDAMKRYSLGHPKPIEDAIRTAITVGYETGEAAVQPSSERRDPNRYHDKGYIPPNRVASRKTDR